MIWKSVSGKNPERHLMVERIGHAHQKGSSRNTAYNPLKNLFQKRKVFVVW